jgi:hypothetical protein
MDSEPLFAEAQDLPSSDREVWMSLEIRSAKVDAMARELATATGEDLETAVERAIAERLSRLHRPLSKRRRGDIGALFDRLARMPVQDDRQPDQIIGYGREGLPE